MSYELLALKHKRSRRTAIVTDEGDSVWLYLTEPSALTIVADCWLLNRVLTSSAQPMLPPFGDYRAQALPPPAPADVVGPNALRKGPLKPTDVDVTWSANGEAAAAWVDGELVGFIAPGERRGYSRHLQVRGPWGAPLDAELFRRFFTLDQG